MAKIHIRHEWTDGEVTEITVKIAASFPDSIAEAKATAVATLRDVFEISRTTADDDVI